MIKQTNQEKEKYQYPQNKLKVIRNLFSIFDPTTEINNVPLNWIRTTTGLLLIPTRIWLIPSRNNIIMSLLINKLHQEMKTILRKGNENKGNSFILTSLFLKILINNFLGLFPHIFTRTRHLTLTLTLALPLWIRFILFGWIKNTNHIFEHLVPQGTPTLLIPPPVPTSSIPLYIILLFILSLLLHFIKLQVHIGLPRLIQDFTALWVVRTLITLLTSVSL